MKRKLLFSVVLITWLFVGCTSNETKKEETEKDTATTNVAEVEEKTPVRKEIPDYQVNDSLALQVADTIIYDVVLKNPDEADIWMTECLRNVNVKAFADVIFNAIYDGRLKAYRYSDDTELTINEVKEIEKEYDRHLIAKMQFVEEWYFDEKELKMGKHINEIMLAYEKYDDKGDVNGYIAGIKVKLNQ